MPKHLGVLVIGFITLLGLTGCPTPPDPGGLTAADFQQININGFDPVDNAWDKNDYAWAMTDFTPDTKSAPTLYVGTGNDMVGLMFQGMSAMMGGGQLGDVDVRPPEIRRYRPDLGPKTWERVLDYRDYEQPGSYRTIGFRFMTDYRALNDGVNYIYASTFGREAMVWRSATGDYGDWDIVWSSGAIGSVRWMEEHNGYLYIALSNDTPEGERLGKIWATDGQSFWPIVSDGFGNPNNFGVMSLISHNGWLYAGTQNDNDGYEIWKLQGPEGSEHAPTCIVNHGGPSEVNQAAITPYVFKGELYWGAMILMHNNVMRGFKAADIIRIHPNDTWETVVGPNSVTGIESGFGHWPNTYIWWMEEHNGWLYASTFDQVTAFSNIVENAGTIIGSLLNPAKREATPFERWANGGADLYKTQDGNTWHPVTLNGFDDSGNYGFRVMKSIGGKLYIGTANPFDGLEIWAGQD